MKTSKLIAALAVIALTMVIVWRAGLIKPAAEVSKLTDEKTPPTSAQVSEPNAPEETEQAADSNEPQKTEDANDPNRPDRRQRRGRRGRPGRDRDPNDPNDPNDSLQALNLKEVEMKEIIRKLADWSGKVVIPDEEAMKQKLTIYSSEKLPKEEALEMIYMALRAKGYVAEESGRAIYIKPLEKALIGSVPMITADQPLASISNKSQVVQKIFKLENYNAMQMGDIVQPMVGEYGYVSSDEKTGNLLVIDTVENLMRIENVINQFDIAESGQVVTEIFEIVYGDPAEMIQLLQMLLSEDGTAQTGRRSSQRRRTTSRTSRGRMTGGTGSVPARSVSVAATESPIILIPEPRRKWIIAKATVEDMKQIAEWIEKLDKKDPVTAESETVQITYADASEVASRLNNALQQMPGSELRASVLVQPLRQARQVMIFGREDMRNMVKKLIAEIDVPSGKFETRVFELKHADADNIKEQIDELYDLNQGISPYSYRRRSGDDPESVRTISFPTLKQITVIASPENMKKIEKQIEEWDVPIDVEQVKPRIIELQNSDPVRMTSLLTTLFSEQTTGRMSFWEMFYGRGQEKKKIVGPLYGQLTFEAVPDTKKIIIISNIPEAYTVVEELIRDLDRMEMAELPMVVTLKYADAEDLCDQLNAILNEPGTLSTLRRSQRGLSEAQVSESGIMTSSAGQDSGESADVITPWWDRSRSRGGEEMPTSNLIGRIRFIPVHRSKAILVLSPQEYQQSIREMIEQLDQPGKQVMVKAIIIQVSHDSMTSLGIKISSNPSAFGAIGENTVTALTEMSYAQTRGSFAIEAGTDIAALVDLLIKQTQAKILNQPTLWTKDNQEAEFFKGSLIPFVVSTQTSSEGLSTKDSVEYRPVGVTLRVRPNITPEKAVDMTINLSISELEQELVGGNIATSELNTTTHMIVDDAQTIMLGGILFQTDSEIRHKIPLFGDLPLLGGLFRHTDKVLSNDELIVFITPFVVEAADEIQSIAELEEANEMLDEVLEELNTALERTDQ